MEQYLTSSGRTITLENLLGAGGEGEVWSVQGRLEVAKLYHTPVLKTDREQKLKAMVANPPVDEMRLKGHVSIAWPTELLYAGKGKKFAGFLMPKIEFGPTIFAIYNPLKRQNTVPGFNWMYLFHTALNLSRVIEAIHYKNYVVGDLNESNILVKSNALVSIIDTDSFQVRGANRQVYRCMVGKEDFTPPELQGMSLDKINRLPQHDNFSLGVLIFRILMEGQYPFAGILKANLQLNEPEQFYCLKKGIFPYVRNPVASPPLLSPSFDSLPPDVKDLMIRCFMVGHAHPKARPSAADWAQVLEKAEKTLIECKANKDHFYSQHLSNCPWCEREARKQGIGIQTPLSPLQISSGMPQKTPLAPPIPLNPTRVSPARPLTPPVNPPQRTSQLPTTSPSMPSQIFQMPSSLSGQAWERVRRFFRSRQGFLDRRVWWRVVYKFLLAGIGAGLGVVGLLYLMFVNPKIAGNTLGVLSGSIVFGLALIMASLMFRYSNSVKAIATFVIFVGGALGIFLGLQVAIWGRIALSSHWLLLDWGLLDGVLSGAALGVSIGNYRALARFKSQALAASTSLLLTAAFFFAFWQIGLLALAFQP